MSTPTQIIHTADTHIGYRQYHRPEREEDYLNAFSQVIDTAIEENVDAVVHAGDLFDSSRPSTDRIYDVLNELQRLADVDIPFLSIVGNHDGRRDRQWLDIFEDIGYATRLGSTGTTIGPLELYGLDHVDRSHRDELTYEYDSPADDTELSALVAHGLFTPFPNGFWDSTEIVKSATVDFDMILAGDDHTPQSATLDTNSSTQITYPGSTERTAADQREPRGYHVITIDPDGELDPDDQSEDTGIDTADTNYVSTERRLLDTRPFIYVDVELEPDEGPDTVLENVREHVNDIEDKVLVVTISGDGERVPTGPIEEFGLEREALTVRVNDRRTLEDDIVEYDEVSFADPESAIEDRKQELSISKAGSDLESIVRSDNIASSNITSSSEERVNEWISDRSIDDFEREEPAEDNTAETTPEDEGDQDNENRENPDEEVVDRIKAAASTMKSPAEQAAESFSDEIPEKADTSNTEQPSEDPSTIDEEPSENDEGQTKSATTDTEVIENNGESKPDDEGESDQKITDEDEAEKDTTEEGIEIDEESDNSNEEPETEKSASDSSQTTLF